MSGAHLTVARVSKSFGGVRAIDDCSFDVPQGACVGLMGPNGAGKSTVFNVVSGLIQPDSGEVRMDGQLISALTPDAVAAAGVGRTFQTPRAFQSLDVLENVLASAPSTEEKLLRVLRGGSLKAERPLVKRAQELLAFVGLAGRQHDGCSTLSGGELRVLEVARQLIREPKILLLDEPTAGVDPSLQGKLAALIKRVNALGTTVLIVEHNLSFLLPLAERVIVLVSGRVLVEGLPSEVREDERVVAAYLGLEPDDV